jgi:Cu/Ag efflux protein CusF
MKFTPVAITLFAFVNFSASAEPGHANMKHAAVVKMSEGTVQRVDKSSGKISIAHGPLENLGMPPMTMSFGVKDKTMLDQVKGGDRIHFVATDMDGRLTVTTLEMAK